MKKAKKKSTRTVVTLAVIAIAAIAVHRVATLFMPMADNGEKAYVYIDNDDDRDSVVAKLAPVAKASSMLTFRILAGMTGYYDNIRPGRYAINSGEGTLSVFRKMRNGSQEPVMLTIPSVRTTERLAHELSKHLMMSKGELLDALQDEEVCRKYGLDTLTVHCLFIPETYEVYWNISVDKLLDRMDSEQKRFWNDERTAKAEMAGMTKQEVVTLASIVDEETANNGEKPQVAGMYINRLKAGMPLQADPTVKYAWRRFDIKRIYHKLLAIDSPYNTYRYEGLPPGPIRIPSVAGIDAVLNHAKSNYLYMCAKEDFSGTHNFAATYSEHLKNAARYTAALNARGIK